MLLLTVLMFFILFYVKDGNYTNNRSLRVYVITHFSIQVPIHSSGRYLYKPLNTYGISLFIHSFFNLKSFIGIEKDTNYSCR